MTEWFNIEDYPPTGHVIVCLEQEVWGSKITSGFYGDDVVIIGCHFEWDMPKVTHWTYKPELP